MQKSSKGIGRELAAKDGIKEQPLLVALLAAAVLAMTILSIVAVAQGFETRGQFSTDGAIIEASVVDGISAAAVAKQEQGTSPQVAQDTQGEEQAAITVAAKVPVASPAPAPSSPEPSGFEPPASIPSSPSEPQAAETLPISEFDESEVLALSNEAVVDNAAAIAGSQEVGVLIAQAQEDLGRDFTDEELELLASGLKAQYAYDQALAEGRAASQQFTAEEQAAIDEAVNEIAALDAEAAQAEGNLTTFASTGSLLSGFTPGGRYSVGVGVYPTMKGKILVTADWFSNLIPTGHAALVINQSSAYTSLPQGVTIEPNDWYDPNRHQTAFGLDVTSTNATQEAKATDWCAQQLGKPYNYLFVLPQRTDAYYCSSLVWQAYKNTCNVNLDTSAWNLLGLVSVHPMEFVDSSKTTLVYRQGTARTGWQYVNGVLYYIGANGNPL
ncbi:MAG: hypothetical protein LBL27_00020 [Coriobacteriales bacterium]|jgi:uncharacterized protein YycO|nr:hypothetical protein [Coriobacteriales bacterium]